MVNQKSNENSEKSSVFSSEIEKFFRLGSAAWNRGGRWSTREGMINFGSDGTRQTGFFKQNKKNLLNFEANAQDSDEEPPKRRSNSMGEEGNKEHHHTMPTTNLSKENWSGINSKPEKNEEDDEEDKFENLSSEDSGMVKSSVSSFYEKGDTRDWQGAIVLVKPEELIRLNTPENYHIAGDILIRINHKGSINSQLIWRLGFNSSFLHIGDNLFGLNDLDPWNLKENK